MSTEPLKHYQGIVTFEALRELLNLPEGDVVAAIDVDNGLCQFNIYVLGGDDARIEGQAPVIKFVLDSEYVNKCRKTAN